MRSMTVTPELFVIPDRGKFILYAPLKGLIASVNQAAINWLACFARVQMSDAVRANPAFKRFVSLGIIEEAGATTLPLPKLDGEFKPTDLVILATTKCNFRCVYCYASAGTHHKHFRPEVARAAIRLAVNNAIDMGKNECHLAFHGGGEPTLVFSFLQDCVEYARLIARNKVEILPGLTTNGYVNDEQLKWLGDNMYSVQVSLDGPMWIHNEQRPLANGRGTFDQVLRTVKYLESSVPELMVKATITAQHAPDMPEIARFFCENLALPRFHLGPVMEAGYSLQTGYGEPDPMTYVKFALEAQEVGRSYGRQILVSLAQKTFPNIRHAFCGITDPNFAITVEGNVSACYEVLYEEDKRSQRFHYGRYVPETDSFSFDDEKIGELQQRIVTNLPRCEKCFAKWVCGGECQIRQFDHSTGAEVFREPDFRCIVNRELVRRKLVEAIKGKNVSQFDVSVDTTVRRGQ